MHIFHDIGLTRFHSILWVLMPIQKTTNIHRLFLIFISEFLLLLIIKWHKTLKSVNYSTID